MITEKFLKDLNLSKRQLGFFSINCCYEQLHDRLYVCNRVTLYDLEIIIDRFDEEKLTRLNKNAWANCWGSTTGQSYDVDSAVYWASNVFAENNYYYSANRSALRCRSALNNSPQSVTFQHVIVQDLIAPPNVSFVNNTNVQGLVNEIYQNKNWNLIPVLRDALIDYNFDDRFIEHLNQSYHRRGCWVLEMLK